jgi:predicted transcriptional regulator
MAQTDGKGLEVAETKAANLRLESRAYSLLHYLASVERRSKAAIVEEALADYCKAHRDRVEPYAREVAALAGLTVVPARGGRTREEILSAHAGRLAKTRR